MSTFEDLLVIGVQSPTDIARLRSIVTEVFEGGEVRPHQDDAVACISGPDLWMHPHSSACERISRELDCETVYMIFQDTSDAFLYEHFISGELVRALEMTDGWTRVEGQPEDWEDLLFREPDGDEESEYWEEEKAAFESGVIEEGALYPLLIDMDMIEMAIQDILQIEDYEAWSERIQPPSRSGN